MLNDDLFNIKTIAVTFLYDAYNNNFNIKNAANWTIDEWSEVLLGYNNIKGYDYGDKVLEYIKQMSRLLF